jgi:hypothetical protein
MADPATYKRCARCGHQVRADRVVAGRYGSDCAELLGLTGGTVDVGQDGPDLFDAAGFDLDPVDECDGWDRPADRA